MSRTTTPVVIYLSTTASQISTLQSTVAGKADAGTEITGGTFSDGTLTLEKSSGNIEIPIASTSGKKLVTSGDITQFIESTISQDKCVTVKQEFDIDYYLIYYTYSYFGRTTISKGKYQTNSTSSNLMLGAIRLDATEDSLLYYWGFVEVGSSGVRPLIRGSGSTMVATIFHSEDITGTYATYAYRLYV